MSRARRAAGALAVLCALSIAAPAASPSPSPAPPAASPSPASSSAQVTPRPPSPPGQAAAPPGPSVDEQLARAARQRLGATLADAIDAESSLAASISANSARADELNRSIAGDTAQVERLSAEIDRLDADISTTLASIELERQQIAELARVAYTRPRSLLVQLAAARSLGDALASAGELVVAGDRAAAVSKRLRADLARLEEDERQRVQDREQVQRLMDEASAALSDLQQLLTVQQSSLGQFGQWMATARAELARPIAAEGAQTALAIADLLVRRERMLVDDLAAAAALGSGAQTSIAVLAASAARLGSVPQLSWPGRGARITQPFGPTDLSLEPAYGPYPHFHTGIDMVIPDRQVLATAPGVVAAVGRGSTGYGNFVMVDQGGGLVTIYAHLETVAVTSGQSVDRAATIGVEGSTGLSTGLHLHFEVRVGGVPVDPLPYLQTARPPV